MDTFQLIVLALIQGLSEFLPISSSAHLILPSQVLGWPDQGLAFDVAVHVGSLLAVIIYFRRDLIVMINAVLGQLLRQQQSSQQKAEALLAWQVAVATIPAVLVAIVSKDFIEAHLRSIEVIATTTILFGLLLGWAEIQARKHQQGRVLNFRLALLIGVSQALAFIPGTSRSGITMTAAVLLGLSRTDAARFSFLLSIPVILGSGLFVTRDLIEAGLTIDWGVILLAVAMSGLTAWSCIALFLKLVERTGFMPFVIYRLVLGAVLIAISMGFVTFR